MEKLTSFLVKLHFTCLVSSLSPYLVNGFPVLNSSYNSKRNPETAKDFENSSNKQRSLECELEEYDFKDIVFLNNTDIFLKPKNITVHSTHYRQNDKKLFVCLFPHETNRTRQYMNCKEKFIYQKDEYQMLQNRSVLLFGEIIPPHEYELRGSKLLVCADDEFENDTDVNNFEPPGMTLGKMSIYVGKIGSAISLVALVMHLFTFCFVPALRNLPGYNLASLSVAFLFAYSFLLIGQIPEVLGLFCVISGVLQQNFFLVAFFCMNVMAFDILRTLKLATQKLILGSNHLRKSQFLWYSLYAWGCPLVISTISVLLDNIDDVPESIKPYFGRNDTCWMTNSLAKIVFFTVPAFTLFVINGIFFIRSSVMISSNLMKTTNDQQRQTHTVTLNYVLYVKLGMMMGITWFIGVIAMIWQNNIVWFIHDFLNSLQGLFLFLLFSCSKKVIKHLKEKSILSKSVMAKSSSCSTKSVSR